MALTAPAEVPVTIGKGLRAPRPKQLRDAFEHADLVGGARTAARQYEAARGSSALRTVRSPDWPPRGAQRADRIVEPRQCQRIHAALEDVLDDLHGRRCGASATRGCGLIQANFGYARVRRSSHTRPGSAFQCSTLPPGCTISYGLMVASPTKMSL